jgi:hypothetical protein
MKTYQKIMLNGLCILGSAIGGAILDHNYMESRVLKAESRLEQIATRADEQIRAQREEHERFISQLPNYQNGDVWSGDALGNCSYDADKGLQDLKDHYRE